MPLDSARIREHFPALQPRDGAPPPVFLDNPAGSQVPARVLERMRAALTECRANLGGPFPTSRVATALSLEAHRAMADLLNAPSEREIVFGANMTTLAFMLSRSLAPLLQPGDEVVLTRLEHDANVTPWRLLAQERGLVVKVLDFDPATGRLDLGGLDALLTERTRFAAIGHASNLLGTVNDVATFCRKARAAGAITFVDAVQSVPHVPVDVQALGCDLLACSAYKFFGPHQGVLWGREEVLERLRPYKLRASPTVLPTRFETGTQSLEGQAGTLGALEYLEELGATHAPEHRDPALAGRRQHLRAAMTAIAQYERDLSARLVAGLGALAGVRVHGITAPGECGERLPTVSVSVPGRSPGELAASLGERGVYVWSGHAYALEVVERLGLAPHGVLRFGAVHYNTVEEIDRAVGALADVLERAPRS
jgi:cysteine desulfurase family protein (TIGR01976 family)